MKDEIRELAANSGHATPIRVLSLSKHGDRHYSLTRGLGSSGSHWGGDNQLRETASTPQSILSRSRGRITIPMYFTSRTSPDLMRDLVAALLNPERQG